MSKAVKSKGAKFALSSKKTVKKDKKIKLVAAAKVGAAKKTVKSAPGVTAKAIAQVTAKTKAGEKTGAEKKAVSQKLLETIEKRKQAKENAPQHQGSKFFVKPPGRRGRRPKNLVDYTPSNQEEEEDSYVFESENVSLEYDTGIQVAKKGDEGGMGLDRIEDFDEELNFDW